MNSSLSRRRRLDQILRFTQVAFDFDGMAKSNRFAARLLVIFLALAVIFIRMPVVFIHPGFWGEDGPLFFQLSYLEGWASATTETAGYLTLLQWLVGNLSTYAPVSAAPALFNAAAIALTLMVVWLVTSPRLPLPAKPLLALAIVTVPVGYELLGNLTNVQWIVPIGAFSILLMKPSKSALITTAEVAFVLAVSLTGPFSILLLPICALQIFLSRDNAPALQRILFLTAAVLIGAVVECGYLISSGTAGIAPNGVEHTESSWKFWLVLPLARMTAPLGTGVLRGFGETITLMASLIVYATAAWFAPRMPYRTQKFAMLLFGLAIMGSGMLKYRDSLSVAGMRFFYIAAVFSIWFFCCAAESRKARAICACVVALAEFALVFGTANSPRVREDSEWPTWSRAISSGLPAKIPTAPKGWFVTLPADPNGPLARFAAWQGKEIHQLDLTRNDAACSGALDSAQSAIDVNGGPPQWIVRGWAKPSDRQRAVLVIVMADLANRVLGFGFPGFANGEAGESGGWAGVVQNPVADIRAYAIISDGGATLCGLSGPRSTFH